ncbi:hypothetical protein CDD83_5392 [Cordyceps sp. RAO-2017]|nr:hypothetical protein CDD83_5392 [Cordyceps sp. RAO-2017]
MARQQTQGPIAGLDVSLRQSGTSPPTVTVSVTNRNRGPVTFLSYDSPLDSMALQLGLLSITPPGEAARPLELLTFEVSRIWPPPADALISLAAGGREENEISLEEPVVPMGEIPSKASVRMSGKWQAVWPCPKDEIGEDALENLHANTDVSTGNFVSNVLEVATTR